MLIFYTYVQVLNLLNEQEVKLVVPTHAITPRTFVMKPGMVLFVGALVRMDYLEVRYSLICENFYCVCTMMSFSNVILFLLGDKLMLVDSCGINSCSRSHHQFGKG